jgi:hypothetical protein
MKLLISFLLILPLINACCNDDYALEMPDVTSTGAQTFGCYVNNELFIGHISEGPFLISGLSVMYYVNQNILFIYAKAKGSRSISLCDTVVVAGEKVRMKQASYNDHTYEYICKDDEGECEMLLTRFDLDLENKKGIVSGLFSFKAKNKHNDSVSVTEGRFDLNIRDIDLYYGQ